MIKRVAVVKFRMDNGCGDGTGDLVREGEMFIKDKAKVTS